jgi:hypothetical protein
MPLLPQITRRCGFHSVDPGKAVGEVCVVAFNVQRSTFGVRRSAASSFPWVTETYSLDEITWEP